MIYQKAGSPLDTNKTAKNESKGIYQEAFC